MSEISTIRGLLADNVGWVLINLVVPVILPPAGLLLARLMPLQRAQRERTRIVTTIQDGQLGWLALAWSAATVYEAWEYMEAKGHVFAWVAILLASEIVVALTAMFIAAGGAVTADTSTNRSTRLSGSIMDRLVGHNHAALEEQLLNVAQAQLEAEVPAHGATDDAGWETVTVIERFRFLHRAILRDRSRNLTMP